MSDENVGGLPELPEPAMHERNPYLGLAVDPYEGLRALKWYSAEQMHAYARAALSAHGQPVVDEAMARVAWDAASKELARRTGGPTDYDDPDEDDLAVMHAALAAAITGATP